MSGIPAWAYRGAKVACIGNRPSGHPAGWNIAVDEVYTVSGNDGLNCISVAEFRNPDASGPFWPVTCFRPLITQQDDLEAHFNQFLNTGKDARQSDIAPVAIAKSRAVPAIAGEGV